MSSITRTSADVTITSDEQELSDTRDAISGILSNGQGYTIFGSRVVNKANLPELYARCATLEKRILLKKGWTGRNYLDHSASETVLGEVPE